jgi:hypothetical protein
VPPRRRNQSFGPGMVKRGIVDRGIVDRGISQGRVVHDSSNAAPSGAFPAAGEPFPLRLRCRLDRTERSTFMNDRIDGGPAASQPEFSQDEPIESAVRRVAGGVSDAVDQARLAATQAGTGIGELRKVIRGQPLTMWFLAIGIGYLLGNLAGRSAGR